MKVLYLTPEDPGTRPLLWSGTALSMLEGLKKLGHEVHVEVTGRNPLYIYGAIKWRFYRWLFKKTFMFDFDPVLRWAAKRKLKKQLRDVPYDLAFAWLPWYLLLLDTDKPKVFWYDTTFIKTVPMYYPDLCGESTRNGIRLDDRIAREADAGLYPSQWAVDSAIQDYGANPKTIHLVPFGANFPAPPIEIVNRAVEQRLVRQDKTMRLLFVGIDWHRKGGDVAVAVTREINRRGVPARLTIVGGRPELPPEDLAVVDIVGRLDKKIPEQLQRMQSLYLEADFFLMPSRAESAAIVYCEAMGSGVPSLAAKTGGIATIVRDNVTGCLVDWGPNTVSQLADYAIRLQSDPPAYKTLCESCYRTFTAEFRWELGWKRLGQIIDDVARERSAGLPIVK